LIFQEKRLAAKGFKDITKSHQIKGIDTPAWFLRIGQLTTANKPALLSSKAALV
jgi:hypothetical protein